MKERDSSVGIATRLQPEWSGTRILAEARDFVSSPKCTNRLSVPPDLQFNDYLGFFVLGVKRLEHEAPSGAEVKNEWGWSAQIPGARSP